MIIEIPKNYKFEFTKNQANEDLAYAYEENGKLIIVGGVPFERLMYDIAYKLSNEKKCFYCGCRLSDHNRTLDHKYPKDFGGISIPQNLVPCCVNCNEKKSNLTAHQFKEYISLRGKGSQRAFRQQSIAYNNKYKRIVGFMLPDDWVSFYNHKKVVTEITLDQTYIKGKRYKKIKTFYKKYKCLPRPIILSSNNFLLDGFLILMYVKNYQVSNVPAIILENVIVK